MFKKYINKICITLDFFKTDNQSESSKKNLLKLVTKKIILIFNFKMNIYRYYLHLYLYQTFLPNLEDFDIGGIDVIAVKKKKKCFLLLKIIFV